MSCFLCCMPLYHVLYTFFFISSLPATMWIQMLLVMTFTITLVGPFDYKTFGFCCDILLFTFVWEKWTDGHFGIGTIIHIAFETSMRVYSPCESQSVCVFRCIFVASFQFMMLSFYVVHVLEPCRFSLLFRALLCFFNRTSIKLRRPIHSRSKLRPPNKCFSFSRN